jgi:coenzyme PQQ precursor peptide PqqA
VESRKHGGCPQYRFPCGDYRPRGTLAFLGLVSRPFRGRLSPTPFARLTNKAQGPSSDSGAAGFDISVFDISVDLRADVGYPNVNTLGQAAEKECGEIMEWTAPAFEEICLNCEINSYASAKL